MKQIRFSNFNFGPSVLEQVIYKSYEAAACFEYLKIQKVIDLRLIPQGTVDDNLGLDRLAGPKALDPNYCRQSTLRLPDLCLEVLTVHCTELRLFWAKVFHLLILLMHASDKAAVGITFNVFSYDVVWAVYRTHHLSKVEQIRYVLCHRNAGLRD